MAVVIETTLGDITVDLYLDQRPVTCLNFLKLCKMKYYNFNLFHTIRSGFIAQTGDPTGEGSGGNSLWGLLEGPEKRFFSGEKMPKIRHTDTGLLSMVCTGDSMVGSQFFLTLGPDLDSLDGVHCVIGEVTEGHDVLRKLNDVICDESHRPYQDVRITHTVILEDPFSDPPGLRAPSRSPSPCPERLKGGRIAPDEELDETQGKTAAEVQEMIEEKEAKARATILEIVGDLPDADIAPPENVLFVCKLNPVTTDEDLEIIFSRFGKIVSCEVIRDKKTGDSLQYAFIEFSDKKSCENAYFKMDNVLIDDRRIHVDFSQSVSKIRWLGKGRGVQHINDDPKESNSYDKGHKNINRNDHKERRDKYDDKRYNKHEKIDERKRSKHNDNRESKKEKSTKSREDYRERRSKSRSKLEFAKERGNGDKDDNHNSSRNEKSHRNIREKSDYKSRSKTSNSNTIQPEYEKNKKEKSIDRSYKEMSHRNDSQDIRSDKKHKHKPDHSNRYTENLVDMSISKKDHKHKSNDNEMYDENNYKKRHYSNKEEDNEHPTSKYENDSQKSKNSHKRKRDNEEMKTMNHQHIDTSESKQRKKRKSDDAELEPRTPSPTSRRPKKMNKKHTKKQKMVTKKASHRNKRKRSTSSSESETSSSSTDSSSSSDSDRKKKRMRRKNKKPSTSTSSSSSSESTTSSSSSESSSDSSSTSTDSSPERKKKKQNTKRRSKKMIRDS